MIINLDGHFINVIIKRKKIKNIYFRFNENIDLCISVNNFMSLKSIEQMIYQNKNSILKLYDRALKENEYNKYFNYLGASYIKVFDEKMKVKDTYIYNDFIYAKNEKALNKFYYNECNRIFNKRIESLKEMFIDLPNFTLKIRFMKTRWGVCNFVNKIITLNSELLKKDINLIDYVIIHEFCHFYYHDHSKNFWEKVATYYPYYKKARSMLKEV